MEHRLNAARLFAVTINGRKLITHRLNAPPPPLTIIIIIPLNIINSSALPRHPSDTTVVRRFHPPAMDACKRAYRLPSKRPLWWTKCAIKAIRINRIRSIIQSEATRGDEPSIQSHYSLMLTLFWFPLCSAHLQMRYVQPAASTCPFCLPQRNELPKSKRSRRLSAERRCSLELQSNDWAHFLSNAIETTYSSAWANNDIRLTENKFAEFIALQLCLRCWGNRGVCVVNNSLNYDLW